MLIACEQCHRQYDVGDFKPGTRVRCTCGQITTVPKLAPRQVQMLHCSNCGGALEGDGESCSFCDAVVDRSERTNLDLCPECMCSLAENANFCNSCGTDIDLEAVVRAVSDRGCPRCEENLVLSTSNENSFYQCTACAGLWLDREHFDEIIAKHEAEAAPRVSPRPGIPPKSVFPVHSYRELHQRERDPQVNFSCPVCRRVMLRKRFARFSAVYIDECLAHGFWLDDGEIQEILKIVEAGGLDEAREKYRRQRRRKYKRKLRSRAERKRTGDPFQSDLMGAIFATLFN